MAVRRNIQYINKDFNTFRNQLINYSQTYFPSTYTDFTNTSVGMMFIEQAAYIGDVLSFYMDNQIQENFVQYARQTDNLYDLAYMYGYKPKATGLAEVDIDFYQQVPAKLSGSTYVPDYDYALYIPENTRVSTTGGSVINFTITEPIDFSVSNSLDITGETVAALSSGNPTYYLLKKTRKAYSGTITSVQLSVGAPQEFLTYDISDNNIAGILDITDSNGEKYYEVDYLGQDIVYDIIKNTNVNDPNTYLDTDAPYLLQTKQVQNRFATRFLNATTLQVQFGAGNPNDTTEEVIPNPANVGLGLPFEQSKLTAAYSPTNFIFTNTYGVSPSNTTLTIRYYTGGGVQSNVLANTVTNLNSSGIKFLVGGLNSTTAQYVFDSLAANNPVAASGGKDGDTIDEIRQNSISNYATQLRNVTQDDYLVRALSMPSQYGKVAKAYTQKPKADESNTTLDLYVLTEDNNNKLTIASDTIKNNLKRYIEQYRMIGDTISIKDAFVINFEVSFEIITYPDYNNNEVLEQCIVQLQNYFDTDKWQIAQPIIVPDLFVLLDNIEGVQTVKDVIIKNKTGTTSGYSQWAYDMKGANQNGTIYPSLDPSIFELKYPNTDIKGRVVNL